MYAKLFKSIYQGTLRGDSGGILVFTNLLANADQTGRVDMHPRAIAEEIGLDVDRVKEILLRLEAPDDESRSPELEGRRIVRIDGHRAWGWEIVNYLKYRAIRNEEDRREQNRASQERWRNKQSKPASAEAKQEKPRKPESAQGEAEVEAYTEVEKRKTVRAVALTTPDDVSPEVWADWVQLRKAKKAPVTGTVLQSARAEAAKAGMSVEQFLRVWCMRGSTGLQADWLKPHERAGPSIEPDWVAEKRERMAEFAGNAAAKRHKPSTTIDMGVIRDENLLG
jgi:hypothetical protein